MIIKKKRIQKTKLNPYPDKVYYKRPCRRCDKLYRPNGKNSKFCEDCKIKRMGRPAVKKKLTEETMKHRRIMRGKNVQ